MATFRWFASLVLATTIVPASAAETHCPGNAASVPLRFVNRHQIVLAVSINHSGPYNFLLDTGMQVTTVDPSLAAKLRLEPRGAAVVAGIGSLQSASYAQLDLLEVGSQSVADQKVLVYDLRGLYSFDSQIQGVLGEDFLELFDVLIDNAHRLLCLDSSSAMRADVRGPHTALVTPAEVADGFVLPSLIIVEARLPDGKRPVRLMLDSGANGAILFNTSEYLTTPQRGYLQGTGVDGRQLIFSALPPQHVKIGSLELSGVPFVALPGTQKDSRAKGFDGVLTLGLFKRIFICHADHFVVLEPR
jgi:Aspartyl protease